MKKFFFCFFSVVVAFPGCATTDPSYYGTVLGTAATTTVVGALGAAASCAGGRGCGNRVGQFALGGLAAGLAAGVWRAEAQQREMQRQQQFQQEEAARSASLSQGVTRCTVTRTMQSGGAGTMQETCTAERQFSGYPTSGGYGRW